MVGTIDNEHTIKSGPKDKKSAHNPQLDTILMVEDYIEENSGCYKRRALWQNLPRKMMYQTYKRILEYLIDSRKVIIDNKGFVCWIPYSNVDKEYHHDDSLIVLKYQK